MQLCVLITFSTFSGKWQIFNSGLKFQILKSQPRVITNNTFLIFLHQGDDNVCNLGTSLQCSPSKQSKLSLASPRKLGFDENSPVQARRQLIPSLGQQTPPPTAKSSPKREETPTGSPIHKHLNKKPPVARLFGESKNSSSFFSSSFVPHLHYIIFHYIITMSSPELRLQSVKQALHTAIPERLMSREAERASIRSFLEDKALQHVPGSLYISGAPGTGKTACLSCVLQEMKVSMKESVVCHV